MNMFKPTDAKTPEEYIAQIEDPERRSQILEIDKFIRKVVPNLEPFIISGMVGYGKYHYKSKSGREGEWAVILLASQKNYISLYACGVVDGKYIAELNALNLATKDKSKKHPKVSVGKSCIRFKTFDDLDHEILKKVLTECESSPMSMV